MVMKLVKPTPNAGPASPQARVRDLMDRFGMSQKDLADQTGLSRSVVSQWLSGKYAHAGEVTPAIDAWVARKMGDEVLDFVELRNSRLVFEACSFAINERRIAAIVGKPGLGKTVALKEFHRRQVLGGREVLFHHVSPAITPASLTRMLASRFELRKTGTAWDILEGVVHKLRRKPTPMLFDEANHLSVKCLEYVRYIYDVVRIPVVLCGSMAFRETLSSAADKKIELEQLQSRIGLNVTLSDLTLRETHKLMVGKFGGKVAPEVAQEFLDGSRGIARDMAEAADKTKLIMAKNGLDAPTVEAVKTAFELQFTKA